jgi:hypothetical protein
MPSDQKTVHEPGNPKTSSIFIGAIVNAKQYRKIPENFKVSRKGVCRLTLLDYGVESEGDETV